MSDLTDMKSAIATRIQTVTDIGLVYTRQRYPQDMNWAVYLDLYKTTISGVDQVRAWWITCEAISPVDPFAFGETGRMYQFVIRGVLGLDDSLNTEDTMQNLSVSVMDAVDKLKDGSISNVIDYGCGPCVREIFDTREFGGVMCHFVKINFTVPIETTITYV